MKHTAETIADVLESLRGVTSVAGLRSFHCPHVLRYLELADGSRLSCQDHAHAAADPGESFEVAYFAPGRPCEVAECEELGESDYGVYPRITPAQIADVVNARGGLKA